MGCETVKVVKIIYQPLPYEQLVEKPVYPEGLFTPVNNHIEMTVEDAQRLAKWRIEVQGYIDELEKGLKYYESFIEPP
jgi:hypothetical protein